MPFCATYTLREAPHGPSVEALLAREGQWLVGLACERPRQQLIQLRGGFVGHVFSSPTKLGRLESRIDMAEFVRAQKEAYEADRPHTDGAWINYNQRVINEYSVRPDTGEIERLRVHTLSRAYSNWTRSIVDKLHAMYVARVLAIRMCYFSGVLL